MLKKDLDRQSHVPVVECEKLSRMSQAPLINSTVFFSNPLELG